MCLFSFLIFSSLDFGQIVRSRCNESSRPILGLSGGLGGGLVLFPSGSGPPSWEYKASAGTALGRLCILCPFTRSGVILSKRDAQLTWRLTAHQSLVGASSLLHKALDLSLPYVTRRFAYGY